MPDGEGPETAPPGSWSSPICFIVCIVLNLPLLATAGQITSPAIFLVCMYEYPSPSAVATWEPPCYPPGCSIGIEGTHAFTVQGPYLSHIGVLSFSDALVAQLYLAALLIHCQPRVRSNTLPSPLRPLVIDRIANGGYKGVPIHQKKKEVSSVTGKVRRQFDSLPSSQAHLLAPANRTGVPAHPASNESLLGTSTRTHRDGSYIHTRTYISYVSRLVKRGTRAEGRGCVGTYIPLS